MPSPLPPSPVAGTTIRPVMAGESYDGPNGETFISPIDTVLVCLYTDGDLIATFTREPEIAIEIALAMQNAAVHIINNQVDDHGNKATGAERIARLNTAYKRAGR